MAAVSGKRKRNKINKDNAGYFFIAPYFIVFLTFTLYPILYTFKLSFMSWDGFGEQQGSGALPEIYGSRRWWHPEHCCPASDPAARVAAYGQDWQWFLQPG